MARWLGRNANSAPRSRFPRQHGKRRFPNSISSNTHTRYPTVIAVTLLGERHVGVSLSLAGIRGRASRMKTNSINSFAASAGPTVVACVCCCPEHIVMLGGEAVRQVDSVRTGKRVRGDVFVGVLVSRSLIRYILIHAAVSLIH